MAPRRPMLLGMVQRRHTMTLRQRQKGESAETLWVKYPDVRSPTAATFSVTLGGRVLSIIE